MGLWYQDTRPPSTLQERKAAKLLLFWISNTTAIAIKLLLQHKQYLAPEANYMGEYEEEDLEAYDVNLCIDDFQPKRRKTQVDETADYE